jgi:hypothetical protein
VQPGAQDRGVESALQTALGRLAHEWPVVKATGVDAPPQGNQRTQAKASRVRLAAHGPPQAAVGVAFVAALGLAAAALASVQPWLLAAVALSWLRGTLRWAGGPCRALQGVLG